MNTTDINETRARHEATLMSLPNVVGVGIGEKAGRPVIKVFVVQKVPPSELTPNELVPGSVEGHEIDVEELGVVEAETT